MVDDQTYKHRLIFRNRKPQRFQPISNVSLLNAYVKMFFHERPKVSVTHRCRRMRSQPDRCTERASFLTKLSLNITGSCGSSKQFGLHVSTAWRVSAATCALPMPLYSPPPFDLVFPTRFLN